MARTSPLAAPLATPILEEIEPYCKWDRSHDRDVLEVHLPKELEARHLTVHLNEARGLKITGQLPSNGNKLITFCKDVRVPKYSMLSEIRATFRAGILRITMPRDPVSEVTIAQTPHDYIPKFSKLKHLAKSRGLLGMNTSSITVSAVTVTVVALWAYKAYRARK